MNRHHYRVFAGVDLGRWQHHVCALHSSGEFWFERSFSHSIEGLTLALDWLLNLAEHRPEDVAVAIEKPHGAVVETLLARGICVFSINPKQVDRFRDRHSAAGAKDDRRDAFVLADALRTDAHRFQRLRLPPPEVVALRELLRSRNQLIKHHVALSSQIRELLVGCWPHLLALTPRNRALDAFFCELLDRFFQGERSAELEPESVQALLSTHRVRRVKLQQILDVLQKPPLCVADATLAATSAHARLLVQQLLLVRRQRRDADQYLERWFEQLQDGHAEPKPSDAAILASLPGVGAFVLASVLSHAHDPIRLRNLDALRSLGGVAPVTKQSGKRRHVLMRRARSQPLNLALHHWAAIAVRRDEYFKAHYNTLRNKGHSHARALRGIMDRILSVAVAMLRDKTLYDASRRANPADRDNPIRKVSS